MPEERKGAVANVDAGAIKVRIYPRTNTKTGRAFYVAHAYHRYQDEKSGEWETDHSYTTRRLEQAHHKMLDLHKQPT